jgi:pyruvate dehydrogenase E2 component (dihydrolipoamide acetyltransferase)
VEAAPRSRIQQLVGKFLSRNWLRIPHVTHHDEVDITDVEERRVAWNATHPDAKIGPVVVIAKAVATALAAYPQFATSLNEAGDELTQKRYAHIGVAVDVPSGLLVPVLQNCDSRSLSDLAAELAEKASRARSKGLAMSEMAGGCITISSLGHIGGTGFTPIVNAPEVAIVGLTRAQNRPRPGKAGQIEWRQMLPVSLSYDHRVINGADAARFVVSIGQAVRDISFS